MTYFTEKDIAERYHKYRPYIHPIIIEKIKRLIKLDKPVDNALDVGCGTGQSTTALKSIAKNIIGIDISEAMLSQTVPDESTEYHCCSAEKTPFSDNSFNLITVGLSIHWFDRNAFLTEANRLLCKHSWLVIYNHGFNWRIKDNPDFREKWARMFIERYPQPSQKNYQPITNEYAEKFGFVLRESLQDEIEVESSLEWLVNHIATWSLVISKIQEGRETLTEAINWLTETIKPYFQKPLEILIFAGPIWCLHKTRDLQSKGCNT